MTTHLGAALGQTITNGEVLAAVEAVNKANTAAGQPNTTKPSWTKTKPTTKSGDQAAQQIAKRFGAKK